MWAKFGEWPWWPGQILEPAATYDVKPKQGKSIVYFYNDEDRMANISHHKLRVYEPATCRKYMVKSDHELYESVRIARDMLEEEFKKGSNVLINVDDGDDGGKAVGKGDREDEISEHTREKERRRKKRRREHKEELKSSPVGEDAERRERKRRRREKDREDSKKHRNEHARRRRKEGEDDGEARKELHRRDKDKERIKRKREMRNDKLGESEAFPRKKLKRSSSRGENGIDVQIRKKAVPAPNAKRDRLRREKPIPRSSTSYDANKKVKNGEKGKSCDGSSKFMNRSSNLARDRATHDTPLTPNMDPKSPILANETSSTIKKLRARIEELEAQNAAQQALVGFVPPKPIEPFAEPKPHQSPDLASYSFDPTDKKATKDTLRDLTEQIKKLSDIYVVAEREERKKIQSVKDLYEEADEIRLKTQKEVDQLLKNYEQHKDLYLDYQAKLNKEEEKLASIADKVKEAVAIYGNHPKVTCLETELSSLRDTSEHAKQCEVDIVETLSSVGQLVIDIQLFKTAKPTLTLFHLLPEKGKKDDSEKLFPSEPARNAARKVFKNWMVQYKKAEKEALSRNSSQEKKSSGDASPLINEKDRAYKEKEGDAEKPTGNVIAKESQVSEKDMVSEPESPPKSTPSPTSDSSPKPEGSPKPETSPTPEASPTPKASPKPETSPRPESPSKSDRAKGSESRRAHNVKRSKMVQAITTCLSNGTNGKVISEKDRKKAFEIASTVDECVWSGVKENRDDYYKASLRMAKDLRKNNKSRKELLEGLVLPKEYATTFVGIPKRASTR